MRSLRGCPGTINTSELPIPCLTHPTACTLMICDPKACKGCQGLHGVLCRRLTWPGACFYRCVPPYSWAERLFPGLYPAHLCHDRTSCSCLTCPLHCPLPTLPPNDPTQLGGAPLPGAVPRLPARPARGPRQAGHSQVSCWEVASWVFRGALLATGCAPSRMSCEWTPTSWTPSSELLGGACTPSSEQLGGAWAPSIELFGGGHGLQLGIQRRACLMA